MSSGTHPMKPKDGIASYYFRRVSERSRSLLKPSSRSASGQVPSSPISGPNSALPSPCVESGLGSGIEAALSAPLPSSRRIPDITQRHSAPGLPTPAPVDNLTTDSHTIHTLEPPKPHLDPTKKHWGGSWRRLDVALRSLHQTVRIFPPFQSAIDTMISCLELFHAVAKHRQDYDDLALDLEGLIILLEKHLRESGATSMSDCVANVVNSINIEIDYIVKKKEQNLPNGVIKADEDVDELIRCYRRMEALFRRLQIDASLSTWSLTHEHLANTRLEAMSPSKLASYDSALPTGIARRTCTESTRTDILSGLSTWSHDPLAAKVYWMNGMAGTGKTTIACSLSEALGNRKQLGASFFCTRTLPECRDVRRIVPTLAYQLARYSRPFQSILCRVLENDPDISTRRIPLQFERLLKDPLLIVKDAMPNNVVVVIDALDECDDGEGVRTMLDTLFKYAAELPLKLFIASRPEPEIRDQMKSQGDSARSVLHLHEIERSLVQADIELYLRAELLFMSPSEEQVKQLAKLAGNLFIYATTAVRYIRQDSLKTSVDPQERFQAVLAIKSESTKKHAELDALYMTILESSFHEDFLEPEELERARFVLWTAICVREPVTIGTLAELAGLSNRHAEAVLRSLRSVLHVSESSNYVFPLHASFPDFVFTKKRSGRFFCDRQEHSHLLTQRCFEVMETELQFNICKLESSFELDDTIKDLEERINEHISRPLAYACQYWADHLSAVNPTESTCMRVEDFLSRKLLFWMEVLNLKKLNAHGKFMLQNAQSWLQATDACVELSKLLTDAEMFLTGFAANSLSLSTPHIYISALPFCHKSSLVYKKYWGYMQGVMGTEGAALEHNGSAPLATWRTGNIVTALALSSDGGLVVFGGGNGLSKRLPIRWGPPKPGHIGILNRYNGKFVVGPFKGHTDCVNSVAFSHDSTRIISGSEDCTICVWSAQDGQLVAGPFEGHTAGVKSVAFSHDSTCIASGSSDNTVCVWNSQDGALIGGPFKGHTRQVYSIAFSPDSMRIVSGSVDKTICIWSVPDGNLVIGPLERHSASIHSVAFSPDGTQIVSASSDATICVWNAQEGTPRVGPFKGHTEPVNSVAFSPDSKRIISGSDDNTICVWGAQDGQLVAGPFKGHSSSVNAVAFCPDRIADSIHIISASTDYTIRMWGVHDGNTSESQFKGHANCVASVAFSPDGTHIVSGSWDKTICLWNVQDGRLLVGPFTGHTDWVTSVAFSPDGTCIVSGSRDATIRVWDTQDGRLVGGPFKLGPSGISSVALSSDGMCIVAGSNAGTISICSVQDGGLILGPLKYFTEEDEDAMELPTIAEDPEVLRWVSFSSNGMHIISVYGDLTICEWDTQDGTLLFSSSLGSPRGVFSVSFSSDVTLVAFGYEAGAIGVFDVLAKSWVPGSFDGCTSTILSIAFSPNSRRIVSGDCNHSIRITNIHETPTRVPQLEGEWTITPSGWVVNQHEQNIFWVPQHFHALLPRPYDVCTIGPQGALRIDYNNILLGDSWSQCYIGA